ncbi:hypothetical protein N1027_17865 [Herbiconiux sp. CPCC 205763]|uniref:Lipoprotein n=1 Tax=Herbiconiux aconitum TaxID=2970913 RepID=A0ABT2GWQ0_9MICO|nr:hypothetical protein [Herbiconiux aconitum]MCS5720002.1 hypothetical protein [Herbiconiux aconitum]
MRAIARRMGGAVVAAGIVGGVLSGCSLLPGPPLLPGAGEPASPTAAAVAETRTVYGFVLITDREMTAEKDAERRQRVWDDGDSSCVAPAGFEDIVAGGEAQVVGPSGVLAAGEIQVGQWDSDVMSANGVVGCGFPIVIEGVPEGLDEYGIHVGDASRPAFAFDASEMRAGPRLFLP